ncbi:MAG: hypothetical protein R3E68_02465 [Burkholderiaceae bacterium]
MKALANAGPVPIETVSESLGRSASVSLARTLAAVIEHRGGALFGDGDAVVIGNRIIVIDRGDGDRDGPGIGDPAIGIETT